VRASRLRNYSSDENKTVTLKYRYYYICEFSVETRDLLLLLLLLYGVIKNESFELSAPDFLGHVSYETGYFFYMRNYDVKDSVILCTVIVNGMRKIKFIDI